MSETPESVVRRLIEEGFNEGNLDVAERVTSPDAVEHQSFGPNHPGGAEGVKAVITSLRKAFLRFPSRDPGRHRRRRESLAPHGRHRHKRRLVHG
jgi:hypothetical protein